MHCISILIDTVGRLYKNTNEKRLHASNRLANRIFYVSEVKSIKSNVTELLNNTDEKFKTGKARHI